MGSQHNNLEILLLRVQRGDALAFESLYGQMVLSIQRFIMARGFDRAITEDVVQEVFCRLWLQRGRFVAGGASAETYILQIALNVAREQRRQQTRISPLPMDLMIGLVAPAQVDIPMRIELADMLTLARTMLSDGQSAAIRLVYDEEIRPRRAAEILGCTEKAVRLRLEKAMRKLRRFLTANPSTQKQLLPRIYPKER